MDVIGSFDNTREWLNRLTVNDSVTQAMESIGKQGVDALSSRTPVDTGQTASGWGYELTTGRHQSELALYNTAHPHVSGNMARMIYTGYSTGTGGYVPPRDYITPAMTPIYEGSLYKAVEAMTNG